MAKKGRGRQPTKKVALKDETMAASGPRVRKLTRRQKRAKAKKEALSRKAIPNSFRLTAQVFSILKRYWKPLGGIVVVYLLLNIVFASGIGNLSTTVSDIKTSLDNGSSWSTALNGFGSLVGSAGASSSSTGSALQSVLIVLESLVIIWALRQLLAGNSIKVKQAYYHSTAQLIPFLLVLFMIIIQLLPLTLGSVLLETVLSSVIGGGAAVAFVFIVLFAILAAWSAYMVSSSIFGIYIVTLPDMQPRRALRSAKNLVHFRRFAIMRRLLFLPIFILVMMGILVVPLILIATWFVTPVFYILSMLTILFVHVYLYSLYRELLK